MEVRASLLFYEVFELPVQADSSQERLLARNVFILEKQGRTDFQISAFQKPGREKRIITNCSSAVATDIVGGASSSEPEMRRRGKMYGCASRNVHVSHWSILFQTRSWIIEMNRVPKRERLQSWWRSEVKKNNMLPRKGNRRREGRG